MKNNARKTPRFFVQILARRNAFWESRKPPGNASGADAMCGSIQRSRLIKTLEARIVTAK